MTNENFKRHWDAFYQEWFRRGFTEDLGIPQNIPNTPSTMKSTYNTMKSTYSVQTRLQDSQERIAVGIGDGGYLVTEFDAKTSAYKLYEIVLAEGMAPGMIVEVIENRMRVLKSSDDETNPPPPGTE